MATSNYTEIIAASLVGGGAALAVVGGLIRLRRRGRTLAELLDLTEGEADVPVEVVTESPEAPQMSQLTVRLGELVGRLDTRGSLARALSRASLPIRAGEYVLLVGVATLILAALGSVLAGTPVIAVIVILMGLAVGWAYPAHRFRKRRETLRRQLPEAFSLIASSVAAGHTFLRSIQLLREEIAPPLAEELDQVVAEVTLGKNLIQALEDLAVRSEITELRWAVQAVRVQQGTGGQLAEILHILADFMRSREEVRREVKVLSAEGRFSAYVLMALPFLVGAALELEDPKYLRPFFQGWGIVVLALCGALLTIGFFVIMKIVDIEV